MASRRSNFDDEQTSTSIEPETYSNLKIRPKVGYHHIDSIIRRYAPEFCSSGLYKGKIQLEKFEQALVHKSMSDENYERLEFLGDSVFHLILSEYLYKRSEDSEGVLTKQRIAIERGSSMVALSNDLGLVNFLVISKREPITESILEDIYEAFVGAFYLNFGITASREFIIRSVEKTKDFVDMVVYESNHKDTLLRYFHKMRWGNPAYVHNKNFGGSFVATISDPDQKIVGRGVNIQIQDAEQEASLNFLEQVGIVKDGIVDDEWFEKMDDEFDQIKQQKMIAKNADKRGKDGLTVGVASACNMNNKPLTVSVIKDMMAIYNVVLPKGEQPTASIYAQAMTHRTYIKSKLKVPERKKMTELQIKLQTESYERLAFVGNALIHIVIAESLFYRYPTAKEGFMTKLRIKLENRETIFDLACKTGLSNYVLISQAIEVIHGRSNVNIISRAFEAFVGALYLQYGFRVPKDFVLEVFRQEFDAISIADEETNYKDAILKLYSTYNWGDPIYKIESEEGPDHSKKFTMGLYLGRDLMAIGKASSKKKAEQIASKKMIAYCEKNGFPV
jgi:dsRNA-specific ribonuclease